MIRSDEAVKYLGMSRIARDKVLVFPKIWVRNRKS